MTALMTRPRIPTIPILEPAQAPWIRPGAVVHDPECSVDDLLARFAGQIREHGFQLAGYVQQGPEELLDLATGRTVRLDQGMIAAARSLRFAMRDDADLVVISRFAAARKAAAEVTAAVADGISQGMPVLTSIGGPCIGTWRDFAGPNGAMLPPDMTALWQWWGPERLYRDLALGVADDDVRRVVCGPRWLMIEGVSGAGLAYLPVAPKELIPKLPLLCRLSLRQLADLSRSWDPLEMAVGIAAINAHYNRFDLEAPPGNGAGHLSGGAGRVVVIGAFPGLSEVFPNAQVIEASPRPGEYPTIAMDTLLPGCGAAVVTSSALINRTLPRILRLAPGARVALIGAATPLAARLHRYGVEVLGGLIVDNPNGLASAVHAGAPPRDFIRFGRYVHLNDERQVP